jgi:hypothetical protein
VNESREQRDLVGQRRRRVPEEVQDVAGALERMRDESAGDDRTDRVQRELERRRDAEVAAAAAHAPEQVGVLGLACHQHAAIGRDDLRGPEVVDREAMLSLKPAKAAAEGQAADTRRRYDAAGARQAVQLGLAVVLAPRCTALRACRSIRRVDVDAFHEREIDQQSAVDRRTARNIVPSAFDRDLEIVVACQIDGVDDVGDVATTGDERRPFVDQPVVHAPGVVIASIGLLEQLAAESCCEIGNGNL